MHQDNMTKVINLYTKEKNRGSIEFTEIALNTANSWQPRPKDFKYIELIARNYKNGLDLMFAYDCPNTRNGMLFFGYFRDGIVDQ